jgi:hypothetical protein
MEVAMAQAQQTTKRKPGTLGRFSRWMQHKADRVYPLGRLTPR